MRLVQITHPDHGRRVALVREPSLILLERFSSVFELATEAIHSGQNLKELVENHLSRSAIDYDAVYGGEAEWSLLPSFDCPKNIFSCLVSGTGLTHKSSALNRQMMHQAAEDKLTDSMKMYQWGLEGGQPADGSIGIQPEWFYKGTGAILTAHRQSLLVPSYASDGGEEPEVAGVYLIDNHHQPLRIGFTTGNEFSDHVMERKNYLYLAPSKLRHCAIGPELVIDMEFSDIEGTVKVSRDKKEVWSSVVHTGEKNMAHSLANLEYHHFKYYDHRQPGQSHVHFFGADAFSFGNGIQLQTGDEMQVHWNGMGRPLVNPIQIETGKEEYIKVRPAGSYPSTDPLPK